MMRALWLVIAAGLLASEASATALLNVGVFTQPGSVLTGQDITVLVQVGNTGSSTAFSVSTTIQVNGTASASATTSPAPLAFDIPASNSHNFTWIYQSSGCGQVSFSAFATGNDPSPVSNSASSAPVPVACTPTNTPTPSPTFTPVGSTTATPTFSPTPSSTPWIVYGTATPGPAVGDASIPGNLYHPDQGQSLQLRYSAPLESTVQIDIYNRIGGHIRHIERNVSPGSYTELWDGRNDQGLTVATGIYVAQFKGKGLFKTVKFAVVK